MRIVDAWIFSVLLACAGVGCGSTSPSSAEDTGSGAPPEGSDGPTCRLHPLYSLTVAGCGAFRTLRWCTRMRLISAECTHAPSEPICIDDLCLNDVMLQCERHPPNS